MKDLFKSLCIMNKEPGDRSFLKRISLAIEIANVARVVGTVDDRATFDEIFVFFCIFDETF